MSTIAEIQSIMRDVFDEEELEISPETTAHDVEEWDSINYVRLIVAIEGQFGIRLPIEKVNDLRNVGELVVLVDELRA